MLISESFFLGLAFLRKARQGISYHISLFLTIINSEVISEEFLSPTNLTKTQTFSIHDLIKVIIVSKDEALVFAAV